MEKENLSLQVETIPPRLSINRLQNGWKEFFCYLSFQSNQAKQVEQISWNICVPKRQKPILNGRHLVTEQEQENGRVAIAALLPLGCDEGEFIVEIGSSQRSNVFKWEWAVSHQSDNFQLPFKGQILVLGGHRIGEAHRLAWQIPSQQMGWDMIPLGKDGLRLLKSIETENLRADDFVAFGETILAPGEGRVVKVVDGQPDLEYVGQLPQDINYYLEDLTRASGNYIILDHGDGIWSCLAHLHNNSVKVKVGEDVEARQAVGEMGNSGYSSGPHLHIHFMDGPDLLSASPLAIEFNIEGETYAPQSGEIVSG